MAAQTGRGRPPAALEAEWGPVWNALTRLENLPREAPEHTSLRAELLQTAARRESAARRRSDRAMAFRARVLAAHLAHLDGLDLRRVRDPGILIDLLPEETLRAAQACMPGPMRTQALIRALDLAAPEELPARAELAREALLEDLEGLRFELAEGLGRAWVAHCENTESGLWCARALRANGRYAEGHDLLVRLERPELAADERAPLALERARLAAARGDLEGALDDLGAALACGSGAAALELARGRLERGENAPALALARAFLVEEALRHEARRVWALALLPPESGAELLAPGVPPGP